MNSILAGQSRFSWGSIVQLLLGLLLLPVSIGYLFIGRFCFAKMFSATTQCNGCGICADNCPNKGVKMWGTKKPRPYWTYSCESCMRCMGYCPKAAIESGHSWGASLYFITSVPFPLYLLNWVTPIIPELSVLGSYWGQILIQYPFMLGSMFISYLIFTLLIRIPLINWLFTHTTLTHLYRRYHEPETQLKDIQARPDNP